MPDVCPSESMALTETQYEYKAGLLESAVIIWDRALYSGTKRTKCKMSLRRSAEDNFSLWKMQALLIDSYPCRVCQQCSNLQNTVMTMCWTIDKMFPIFQFSNILNVKQQNLIKRNLSTSKSLFLMLYVVGLYFYFISLYTHKCLVLSFL